MSILTAFNVGNLSGNQTATQTGLLGSANPDDYYRFTLNTHSRINLTLSALAANANLELIQDRDHNGLVDAGEIIGSSRNPGTASEALGVTDLDAGTYYIRVARGSSTDVTSYTLNLATQPNSRVDLLWRYYGAGGANATWTLNGNALESADWLTPVNDPNWRLVGTGDFNGDGQTDLVWRYYGVGGANAVWYMNGSNIIGSDWLTSVNDPNWQIVGTGDFNSDGQTDLLWRYNGLGGANAVWYMNGSTIIGSDSLPSVSDPNWRIAGTGDFNGDGRTDLLWRYNGVGGANAVWYMNGNNLIGAASLTPVNDPNWRLAGTGDFNGDGQIDLLWRYNGVGGANAVWYLNGVNLAGVDWLPAVNDPNWQPIAMSRFDTRRDRNDNSFATAFDLGTLNDTSINQGSVSSTDPNDYYRFTLDATRNFNLALTGLGADADVQLFNAAGTLLASSTQGGILDEMLNQTLTAGSYVVQVSQFAVRTNYSLRLTTTPASPSIQPSNLLSVERDMGALITTPQSFTGAISSTNTSDIFRFDLATTIDLNLALTGLTNDLDLRLIRDRNSNGLVDEGDEVVRSQASGTTDEAINLANQAAGTYFLQVYQFFGASNYTLRVSTTTNTDPSNLLPAEVNVGSLSLAPQLFSGSVDDQNTSDVYRFNLATSSNLNVSLTGLTNDIHIRLIRDVNGNGVVDTGDEVQRSARSGSSDESMNLANLTPGTYFIQLYQFTSGQGNYTFRLSATPPSPATVPSNLLPLEFDVGVVGNTPVTFSNSLGNTNTADVYRFNLATTRALTVDLTGLSSDVDVRLIQDRNNNGIVDDGDELARSQRGSTTAEQISQVLTDGTYFIQVYQYNGNSNYTLRFSTQVATVNDPGNTLATAEVLNSPIFIRNQQVSATDLDDFYRVAIGQSGIFTLNLTGLTGDADVRLIQDQNNNGQIDQGEVLAWQWERSTGNESLRRFLSAGTYFVQVISYRSQTANYTVATNFTPAATDDRDFAIQINFVTGSEGLSAAMREAVLAAARFWENVIPYSSFNGSQILTIDVGGRDQRWTPGQGGVLASAGPRNIAQDSTGRWMPTNGIANINTNPGAVSDLSADIDFFTRVMIHEFGHVLGIGTFWGAEPRYGRNLVDRTAGTYSRTTDAGWAYGELLGTFVQTAIPVTVGVGAGSDYAHWREEVFDNELMTHAAGGRRPGLPLSQVTIAALRDLGWNVNYGAAEPYTLL